MSAFSEMAEFLEDGLLEMESFLGSETFTWNGKEVVCIPNALEAGSTIEIGGRIVVIVFMLIVRKTHFLTVDSTLITADSGDIYADSDMPHPVAGRTIIFRGKTFRIATAKEAAGRGHYEITLEDQKSGR